MGRRTWTGTARATLLRHAPRVFLYLCKPSHVELGAVGEELAARHLSARGWRILGRRVPTREGELDLVCTAEEGDRTELVCVEVKTTRVPPGAELTSLSWRPGERLDRDRLVRQRRAAHHLARGSMDTSRMGASRRGSRETRGRVDLFEVWISTGQAPQFAHHADVLRPLEHGITPFGRSVTNRGSRPHDLRS